MSSVESSTLARSRWWANVTKVSDFLLFTEPVWVSAAASFVYLSVISDWASYIPWLCLAFAFVPFPLRLIRYGYPSHRTPFDIPILVLLGSMIAGMVTSGQFDISLGAFQTFLAGIAFYYSLSNYSKPSWLIIIGMSAAAVGAAIASAFAAKWAFSNIFVPHGIGIALVIIGAIALGITIFARHTIHRLIGGLLVSLILGSAILFTHEALNRLFTLVSIEGRMRLWLEVITPLEGSSLWTGLGLGCWPSTPAFTGWMGHVHNAYLEIYINTGVAGMVALICFMAVGAKLAVDIIYSSKSNPYYGFGIGVLLATLAILLVSFVESAPFGYGLLYRGSYHYILSPILWILAGSLVIGRRLLIEHPTIESTETADLSQGHV